MCESMSKLFNTSFAFLLMILIGIFSQSTAQTKKQEKKKPKIIQVAPVIEYPAEPGDPFYKATVGLPIVDKVEVLYITHIEKYEALPVPSDNVEIRKASLGHGYDVITKKVLKDKAAEDFAKQWRRLLRSNGAGCYTPAYAMKFLAGDRVLLETGVCYHCRNIVIPGNTGQEIRGFNAEGKSGQELLKTLQQLFPESKANEQTH